MPASSPRLDTVRALCALRTTRWSLVLLIPLSGGCHRALAPLAAPGASAFALTGGPNTSMVYVARTTGGVLAIDLGWTGANGALSSALRQVNASPSDVSAVFLTHSHRDHVAAWPAVRGARFFLAAAELPFFLGAASHRGWITRFAERLKRSRLPRLGELRVTTFTGDTAFVVGADTLRAYLVPGHTPGSAAYLFRGVLFLGDAATYSRWSGFAPAKRGFSGDRRLAVASLQRLWSRLPSDGVHHVCTAHAHCTPFTSRFREEVSQRGKE